MKVDGFLLVASLLASSSGHIGGKSPYQDTNLVPQQTYCGRHLAQAIATVCYEADYYVKRADPGTYNSILSPYYKEQESHNWPWMSAEKAMGMGSRRNKRFLVDECCEKPCSIDELKTYC